VVDARGQARGILPFGLIKYVSLSKTLKLFGAFMQIGGVNGAYTL